MGDSDLAWLLVLRGVRVSRGRISLNRREAVGDSFPRVLASC